MLNLLHPSRKLNLRQHRQHPMAIANVLAETSIRTQRGDKVSWSKMAVVSTSSLMKIREAVLV